MGAAVQLVAGTLPPAFCPASEQARYLAYIAATTGLLPGNYSTYVAGDTTPSVNDQNKIWARTTGGTIGVGKLEGLYTFFNAGWYRPHEIPVGSGQMQMWYGDPGLLPTFDGGSAVAVTDFTGPFWQIVAAMAARIPIGVGTTPAPSSTVLALNVNGGSELATLDITNVPSHTHTIDPGKYLAVGSGGGGGAGSTFRNNDASDTMINPTGGDPNNANLTKGFSIMPLYRPVYFIERTLRIYRSSTGT